MKTHILQFGTTGQLGRELLRQAPAWPVHVTTISREQCDFSDPELAARWVMFTKPDLVINAVAYTGVDAAESDIEAAHEANAETPAAIAMMCGVDAPAMVHISSDYVFDGEKGAPYLETDEMDPVSVYGGAKASGDRMVLACCDRALILRASWVISAHGKNFVKTMLRLAREGKAIRVVDDQFGRPTSAADLAGFILANAERLAKGKAGDRHYGLFHFANAGETTWRRLAEAVFEDAFGAEAPKVAPITTAEYPTPARRPKRGTLDTSKLERVYGYTPRPWREAVKEIVGELMAEQPA